MTVLELQGTITENGELKVDLPIDIPAGQVTVRIEIPDASVDQAPVRRFKSNAEAAVWLRANPPIEMVDPEIDAPVEWVKAQRRSRARS